MWIIVQALLVTLISVALIIALIYLIVYALMGLGYDLRGKAAKEADRLALEQEVAANEKSVFPRKYH